MRELHVDANKVDVHAKDRLERFLINFSTTEEMDALLF